MRNRQESRPDPSYEGPTPAMYTVGLPLAGALWLGIGQSIVHHYVFKQADQAAHARFACTL